MIIKSISLENFRQYKDPVTIEFSNSTDKNVTVFLGDNSNGKSTLIQAFIWTIYNKEKLDLQFPDDVLNKETLSGLFYGGIATVSVKIILVHGGVEYIFFREQTYKCTEIGRAKLDKDTYKVWYVEGGETIPSSSPGVTRDKILPEDLAEFFFFDGEHIKKLSEKKNLKKSISKLLGLLPLQNAVKDLGKVVISLEQSMPSDEDEAMRKAIKERDMAISSLHGCNERFISAEKAYNSNYSYYERLQEELSNNKLTSSLIESKKSLNNKRDKDYKRTNLALVDCSKKFNSCFFNVLSASLIEETKGVLEKIKDGDIAEEAVPYMHADSIKYILERGKCICGADLKEHPDLRKHIEELVKVLPPNSIGTELAVFKSEIGNYEDSYESSKQAFDDALSVYYTALEDLDDDETQLSEIDVKLEGHDYDSIETVKEKYMEAERNMKTSKRFMDSCEYSLKVAKVELDKKETEVERQIELSKKYAIPRLCRDYAVRLARDIDHSRAIKEENMLRDFRIVLKNVFDSMYHGEREVIVDDNYNVMLNVPGVGETSISEGTEAVLGFAYVCSFLKMALDLMDDDELSSEPHALVMDAPTSTQDDKHIANVFKYTITVADQIILFINNKDWQYVKTVIEPKVDKVYNLNKKSEICTNIEVIE